MESTVVIYSIALVLALSGALEDATNPRHVIGASGFRFSGTALAAAFNPTTKRLSIVTSRGELWRFDATTGAAQERTVLCDHPIQVAALSADGLIVAAGDLEGRLVIQSDAGKRTTHELGRDFLLRCLGTSNDAGDARVIACGAADQGAKPIIFSGPEFSTRRELYLFVRPPLQVSFSPSGSRMFFAGDQGIAIYGKKPSEEWRWSETAPRGETLRACFLSETRIGIVDRLGELYYWDYERELSPKRIGIEKNLRDIASSGRPDRFLVRQSSRYARFPLLEHSSLNLISADEQGPKLAECETKLLEQEYLQPLLLPMTNEALAVVGPEAAIRLFLSTTGKLQNQDGAETPVVALDVAPDGTIGAAFRDGSFRLLKPPRYEVTVARPPTDPMPIRTVNAANDSKTWVLGRDWKGKSSAGESGDVFDSRAGTWTPIRVESTRHFDVHPGADRSEVLLQVKQYGGTFGGPLPPLRPIRRFDVATREMKDVPTRFASSYGPIAWTPANGLLLAATDMIGASVRRMTPETIEFFDGPGNRIGTTPMVDGELLEISFDRSGSSLAVCQGVEKNNQVFNRILSEIVDALITIRDVPAGNITGTLRLSGRPKWARFDDNAKWCLVGFDDRVEVLDLAGTPKQASRLKTDYVPTCGAWITPGKTVAIGGDDTRVRIYDVAAKP